MKPVEIPDNYLDREVLIDICKDGTISYRERSSKAKRLNDAALPTFSVDTVDEAKAVQLRFGSRQEAVHPKQPGRDWYKLSWPLWQGDLEDLDAVALGMTAFWIDVLVPKKTAPPPGTRWAHRRDGRVVVFERLDFETATEREGKWTLRVQAFAVYSYVSTPGDNPGRLRGRTSTSRSATPEQRMPFAEWRALFPAVAVDRDRVHRLKGAGRR